MNINTDLVELTNLERFFGFDDNNIQIDSHTLDEIFINVIPDQILDDIIATAKQINKNKLKAQSKKDDIIVASKQIDKNKLKAQSKKDAAKKYRLKHQKYKCNLDKQLDYENERYAQLTNKINTVEFQIKTLKDTIFEGFSHILHDVIKSNL